MNIQLGNKTYEITDAWASNSTKEVHVQPQGFIDEGQTYVSLKLTEAQKKELGNTGCNYLRLALKTVKEA